MRRRGKLRPDCRRERTDLGKRLAAGFIGALVAGSGHGEEATARRSFDLPPPIDQLIGQPPAQRANPPPPQPSTQARRSTVQCKAGDTTCDDLLGWGGGWMWEKIRKCWRPPMRFPSRTVVVTAVRFGDDGRSAVPPDRTKTIISIVFGLNPNGTLARRPEANAAEPTAATKDMISDAIMAVERCQPYDMLPQTKYERWQNVFLRIGIEFESAAPQAAKPESARGKAAASREAKP